MDIHLMRAFFKWCTILNGGLLIVFSLIVRFAGAWVFGMHSQWIPISEDSFPDAIYLLLGLFKIFVIACNLVPYVALVIIGRKQAAKKSAELL